MRQVHEPLQFACDDRMIVGDIFGFSRIDRQIIKLNWALWFSQKMMLNDLPETLAQAPDATALVGFPIQAFMMTLARFGKKGGDCIACWKSTFRVPRIERSI
ncbi:MAG: hypothetical protein ACO3VS_11570, partial [Limisphaerales bacterium]